MSEVKDVLGKPVKLGDTVAFAGASRGASQFFTGEVVRFAGTKSISIKHDIYTSGHISKVETVRKSGCFVIVEEVAND